jgi:hypothetical protein
MLVVGWGRRDRLAGPDAACFGSPPAPCGSYHVRFERPVPSVGFEGAPDALVIKPPYPAGSAYPGGWCGRICGYPAGIPYPGRRRWRICGFLSCAIAIGPG